MFIGYYHNFVISYISYAINYKIQMGFTACNYPIHPIKDPSPILPLLLG